jgi:hypothetical protein
MSLKSFCKVIVFAGIVLLSAGAGDHTYAQLTNIPSVQSTPKPQKSVNFLDFLNRRLQDFEKNYRVNHKGIKVKGDIDNLCPIYSVDDEMLRTVASRVLLDYGAIFVGDNNAFAGYRFRSNNYKFVAQCVFNDPAELRLYQEAVELSRETIGKTTIMLQKDAMAALLRARSEAAGKGLSITPRGGSEAAGRSYEDTVRLWNSRFYPALNHWVKKGRIPAGEATLASRLPTIQQVARVLKWEEDGIWFNTDFSKSILYSVAAPGASQHLFFLALDVQEFGRKDVRNILEKHGWFQTVYSDLPHFTYLGISKQELPKRGLVYKTLGEHEFWVPGIE